jgi:hypothetical protein
MPDLLLTYYIQNTLVIISINNGSWGMIIRLDIEIWVIGTDDTKKEGWEKRMMWEKVQGVLVLWPLFVFG